MPTIRTVPSIVGHEQGASADKYGSALAAHPGESCVCSNSQFICIRRPARTSVLPVPRDPDAPSLTKPDYRTDDGTENNMPDNGFIKSFNSRLRDELLNGTLITSLAQARVAVTLARRLQHRAPKSPGRLRPSSPAPSLRDGRLCPLCQRLCASPPSSAQQGKTHAGNELGDSGPAASQSGECSEPVSVASISVSHDLFVAIPEPLGAWADAARADLDPIERSNRSRPIE